MKFIVSRKILYKLKDANSNLYLHWKPGVVGSSPTSPTYSGGE